MKLANEWGQKWQMAKAKFFAEKANIGVGAVRIYKEKLNCKPIEDEESRYMLGNCIYDCGSDVRSR